MTKSRKRMLISSIAMLLVALVALGSATYAWFTLQRTVKADAMQVTATAQKGIEITIDNGGHGGSNDKSFTAFTVTEQAMNPNSWSSDKTAHGFVPALQVTADNATSYNGTYKDIGAVPTAVNTPATEAKTKNNYFAVYRVGVRSALGNGDSFTPYNIAAAVTISRIDESSDATGYARVALYNEKTGEVVATYAAADSADSAVSGTAATAKETVNLTPSGTAVDVSESNGTWAYYQLIIWFEGTDDNCVDDNANKGIKAEISFTASDKT